MESPPQLSEREKLKVFGAGVLVGLASATGIGTFVSYFNRKDGLEEIYFMGSVDGGQYSVERTGENTFRIVDKRPGNELPSDRVNFLTLAAGQLQNSFGCDITSVEEVNHEFEISVSNPRCMFDARDSLQNPNSPAP